MKAAEATEWGKDQGPRDEAKGRFCITTVKSHPKLTSRASDTDTCVASETGALSPLDHPQCVCVWGGHRVHGGGGPQSPPGARLAGSCSLGLPLVHGTAFPPPAGASPQSPAATF